MLIKDKDFLNHNYNEYVHVEALQKILRFVPNVIKPDGTNILNIAISNNNLIIYYLDNENNPKFLTIPLGKEGKQGPKGDQGPQGEKGPQGPKGDLYIKDFTEYTAKLCTKVYKDPDRPSEDEIIGYRPVKSLREFYDNNDIAYRGIVSSVTVNGSFYYDKEDDILIGGATDLTFLVRSTPYPGVCEIGFFGYFDKDDNMFTNKNYGVSHTAVITGYDIKNKKYITNQMFTSANLYVFNNQDTTPQAMIDNYNLEKQPRVVTNSATGGENGRYYKDFIYSTQFHIFKNSGLSTTLEGIHHVN